MGSRLGKFLLLAGVALALASARFGAAQGAASAPAAGPESTLGEALDRLANRAGVIFIGTVDSIDDANGVVEVGLRVERILEGEPGTHYVLREWAGLWPPGRRRYTMGERALFFLPRPGVAGLSSPVDGQDGVIPLYGEPADDGAVLDIRRLTTRLLRTVGAPLSGAAALPLRNALEAIAAAQTSSLRRPANPSGLQPVAIVVQAAGAQARAEVDHAQR